MGNCNFKTGEAEEDNFSQSQFRYLDIIGKGGFSKVWIVEVKKTKQKIALKMMSKARIISKKSVNSAMNELQLLSQLKHPKISNKYALCFLGQAKFIFRTRPTLRWRFKVPHLQAEKILRGTDKYFSQAQLEFFVMCIMVSLEYLHSNSVIHRDVKPENLVFDDRGYLHLTDLGIARIWKPSNSQDTSGTPGYMAPEVMCRQNHGVSVDYYAIGVIVYELMLGRRPYVGKNRQEIRESILARQVQIGSEEIPYDWSTNSAEFANKLIVRKSSQRLGDNGPEEIKRHPWLLKEDWQGVSTMMFESPFVPTSSNNYNKKAWIDSQPDVDEQNELMLRRDSIQGLFQGYSFGNHNQSISNVTMSSQRSSSVSPMKSFL